MLFRRVTLTYELVTCDKNMEGSVLVVANLLLTPKLAQCRPIFHIPPVGQCLKARNKARYFLLPVVEC